MQVVVLDHHIHGGVELDACHLSPPKGLPPVAVMDVVAHHGAEGPSQAPHHPRLPAVVDVVAVHAVGAHAVLVPAIGQGAVHAGRVGVRLAVVVGVVVTAKKKRVRKKRE